jgi:PAS domain S-box-containing protein
MDGFLILDASGKIHQANKSYCQLTGYSELELLEMNINELKVDQSRQLFAKDSKLIPKFEQTNFLTQHRARDGRIIDLEACAINMDTADGRIIVYYRDISEYKRKEAELIKTREEKEGILDTISDAFITLDHQIRFIYINHIAEELIGRISRDLVGKNLCQVFPQFLETDLYLKLRQAQETGEQQLFEEYFDSYQKWFSIRIFPSETGVSAYFRDITDRKQNEIALRESEERYRAFIEQSTEGIWCYEFKEPLLTGYPLEKQIEIAYEHGYLVECNNAFARMYGYSNAEDLIGIHLKELMGEIQGENSEFFKDFIKAGYKISEAESSETDINGNPKNFLNNVVGIVEDGKLIRVWGIKGDITEQRKAEKALQESENQIRQIQKMEAVGKLAGGIAHDFNNLLAVIMLHLDMFDVQLPENSVLRKRIKEIQAATNRAAGLTRQLLAFSRKSILQPRSINLNYVVLDTGKMLNRLIGEDIELCFELQPDLGLVLVDPDQISQVMMNLAINARDAMPNGGKLTLQTSNITFDHNQWKHSSQPLGDYIELRVTDTGHGMDETVQEHIFEPFFTTKEPGKGTGLGLATVYGIVKQSNGFIWVNSAPGKGTTFRIHFPRLSEKVKENAVSEETELNELTGDETILIVEDEGLIRRAATEVLSSLGYNLLEAKDGEEALKLVQNYKNPIHLLLTDVVMPRMNGKELVEKLQGEHPETAIIYMSGYTNDMIDRHGVLEEGTTFLEKPFTPSFLVTKVREKLNEASNVHVKYKFKKNVG